MIREISLAQWGWYSLYLFLAIYIPEFIADRFAWERMRPSWILVKVAAWATNGAMALGRFIGYVSSFVDYLRFEMFYVPLFKLLKPGYDLCISWLWVFTGYVDFAEKFNRTGIVYWGTYLILVAIYGMISYSWYTIPWMHHVMGAVMMAAATYSVLFILYYGGNVLHGFVKTLWNMVNKNNILLVGRSHVSAEPEPSATEEMEHVAERNPVSSKKKK